MARNRDGNYNMLLEESLLSVPRLPGNNDSWPHPPASILLTPSMLTSAVIALVVTPAVLIGVCANIHLLAVLVKAGVGKSPARVLTVGLCMADLTSLGLALPLGLLAPFPHIAPPSHVACTSAALAEKLSVGSAIYFLSCLTLHKYLKICRPHFWQFTTRRAVRVAVTCPCLVALVAWPSAVTVGTRAGPHEEVTCGILEVLDVTLVPKAYRRLQGTVILLFLLATAFLYLRLFRQLRALGKGSNSSRSSVSSERGVTSPWSRMRAILCVKQCRERKTVRTEPSCLNGEAGSRGQGLFSPKRKKKLLFAKGTGQWPGRKLFSRRKSSSDRKSSGTSGSYRLWSLGTESVSEYDNFPREELEEELSKTESGVFVTMHLSKPISRHWDLEEPPRDRKSYGRSISHQMERMYVFPRDGTARFYSMPWRNHKMTSNTFIDLLGEGRRQRDEGRKTQPTQHALCSSYLSKVGAGEVTEETGGRKGRTETGSGREKMSKGRQPRWCILIFLAVSFPVLLLSFLPSPALHLVEIFAPVWVASLATPFRQIWKVALRAYYFRCIVDPLIHIALQPRSRRKASGAKVSVNNSARGSS